MFKKSRQAGHHWMSSLTLILIQIIVSSIHSNKHSSVLFTLVNSIVHLFSTTINYPSHSSGVRVCRPPLLCCPICSWN